ncbi:hypothetical protein IMSAGC020_00988 [Lachnospiraceae bacterium]|jgi:hypothetical protein|nr:hypothetical protein IMSAGC020_00988 [Lachnospiraceae bacterium]
MNLKESAFALARHLHDENIIKIDDLDRLKDETYEEIVLLIRQKLQETYPQTKLKRMMKSVHFANGFPDERLKRVAIILTDEIEQYLNLNKFLDHDTSVEFFNNRITSAGFVINPTSLVETAFESLCICKGRKVTDM